MSPTRAGMILGTAPYMSPEQARGAAVDKRADIWAFGCVLYEMLTGKQAFHGETTSDILAAVLKEEPDWSRIPARSAASFATLPGERSETARLRDIGDAMLLLDERAGSGPRGALGLVIAAGAGDCIATITGSLDDSTAPALASAGAAHAELPPDTTVAVQSGSQVALSPDGTRIAVIERYRGRQVPPGHAPARSERVCAALGHRRRYYAVLFSGWPMDRILRRWQAQEDRDPGRCARNVVRRALSLGARAGVTMTISSRH